MSATERAVRARTTEDRLAVFDQAPGFIAVLRGPEHRFEFVNQAYVRLTGRREFVGHTVREVLPEIVGQGFFELLDRVYATGARHVAHAVPVTLARGASSDLETRHVDFVYAPILDDEGRPEGIFVEGHDVTDAYLSYEALRQSQRRQTLLIELGDRIRNLLDPDEISYAAAELLGRALDVSRAGYGTIDAAAETITIARDWNAPGIASLAGTLNFRDYGSYIEDLKRGETVVFADAETDPRTRDTAAALKAISAQAVVNMPVTEQGGFVALLYLNHETAREWTPDELALIREVAERTRTAVERRRAEQRERQVVDELRQSESRLRIAQRAGQIGAFELLPAQGRILVSPEFCRLWGVPVQAEYETQRLLDLIDPDDAERIETGQAIIDNAALGYVEYRIRRPDTGEVRWMARRGEVIADATGTQRYFGVSYDITDRKTAELALQSLNESLEAQVAERTAERDRMWRLSAELMLVADFQAKIQAVNPAWRETLGYEAADLEGSSFLDLVHPDDIESTLREVGSLADGATTFSFENRYRHKDGSYRCLSWTAVPDAQFIHAVARDVTAEREAAAALKRTEEALRQSQKMEAVGQLTGGIAHDFNNMLAIVTGSLDLAQRRLERGQPGAEKYIEHAREGANRAAALTQRLLAFSRQQPLSPRLINLNRLVGDLSELLRRTLGELISLETVQAAGLWTTNVDPNQLESALVNLAVNARDAMPEGGRLTIETANTYLDEAYVREHMGLDAGQYVMVAVSDTGSGMAPDVLARVFDPFFTTKPVGKGTGLGLSMVYGFVKQSGGHVAVYSELTQGTTVKIYLPRHSGPAQEMASDKDRIAPAPAAGAEVILVVEDEERVRRMSIAALQDLGYTVHEAVSGEDALRIVQTLPRLDLLFTDVVMPGMTGRKLAQRVHELRPDVRVLFTTGYTRNAVVHNGVLDGDVAFIAKPFTIAALGTRVREVLDRTRA